VKNQYDNIYLHIKTVQSNPSILYWPFSPINDMLKTSEEVCSTKIKVAKFPGEVANLSKSKGVPSQKMISEGGFQVIPQ